MTPKSKPQVIVTRETESGRNTQFQNTRTHETMTRPQFVRQINNGNYPDYYVREINGLQTPVSKPDGKTNNNLG